MKAERIAILDILRGTALIGILLANIPGIARADLSTPADFLVYRLLQLTVEQRFFPIFSYLFGLGVYMFMRNAEAKGRSPYGLIARRLGLLILLGIAHQFLQPGEALLFYGILGFALLPFFKASPKITLGLALLLLPLSAFLSEFLLILSMFFVGQYLGQIGYFDDPSRYLTPTRRVWWFSIVLIVPALLAQEHWRTTSHYATTQMLAGLAIATAITTSLVLWPQTNRIFHGLAAFGRMALTNYILQTVIVLLITILAGGYGTLPLSLAPILWIAIFPIQIILSNLWLSRFPYGPLEWLWRWGTYGHRPQQLAYAN